MERIEDACGGYKITILNHTKSGEFKYNIYSTRTGKLFKTNNIQEFVSKLEDILSDRAYEHRQKEKGIRVRTFRLTDAEWEKVKEFIQKMREKDNER